MKRPLILLALMASMLTAGCLPSSSFFTAAPTSGNPAFITFEVEGDVTPEPKTTLVSGQSYTFVRRIPYNARISDGFTGGVHGVLLVDGKQAGDGSTKIGDDILVSKGAKGEYEVTMKWTVPYGTKTLTFKTWAQSKEGRIEGEKAVDYSVSTSHERKYPTFDEDAMSPSTSTLKRGQAVTFKQTITYQAAHAWGFTGQYQVSVYLDDTLLGTLEAADGIALEAAGEGSLSYQFAYNVPSSGTTLRLESRITPTGASAQVAGAPATYLEESHTYWLSD